MKNQEKKSRPLFVLFFTILLDMLGLGILIPVMPVLFTDPTSAHYFFINGETKEMGYLVVGILFALFSFGQFISAPIIGQFSDKFGRKRMLAFSVCGSAIGHSLFTIGIIFSNLPLLFFARLFSGISAGNIVVAQASIADITRPENRAKNFGLIGAAFGLGFIVGPYVGARLVDTTLVSWFSTSTPFLFAALLSILNLILIQTYLNETNMHIERDRRIQWGRALLNIARATKIEKVRHLFFANFLFQGGFAFYSTFAGIFLLTRFGFTEANIGSYFAYVGIWIVITQGFITRFLSGKIKESVILQCSMIAVGIAIAGNVLAPSKEVLYLIIPFFAIAVGLTQANITALISRSAGPSIQGEVLGINGSVVALSQTIPPFFAGLIATQYSSSAPLLVSALLTIAGGLYFLYVFRSGRLSVAQ